MIFKIGQIVSIRPNSEYFLYGSGQPSAGNPKFMRGEVIHIRKEGSLNLPVKVKWDNGKVNTYEHADLLLNPRNGREFAKPKGLGKGSTCKEIRRANIVQMSYLIPPSAFHDDKSFIRVWDKHSRLQRGLQGVAVLRAARGMSPNGKVKPNV